MQTLNGALIYNRSHISKGNNGCSNGTPHHTSYNKAPIPNRPHNNRNDGAPHPSPSTTKGNNGGPQHRHQQPHHQKKNQHGSLTPNMPHKSRNNGATTHTGHNKSK